MKKKKIIKKTIAPYSIGEFFAMAVEHHFEKEVLKNERKKSEKPSNIG